MQTDRQQIDYNEILFLQKKTKNAESLCQVGRKRTGVQKDMKIILQYLLLVRHNTFQRPCSKYKYVNARVANI